jgi:hypothetical protein
VPLSVQLVLTHVDIFYCVCWVIGSSNVKSYLSFLCFSKNDVAFKIITELVIDYY